MKNMTLLTLRTEGLTQLRSLTVDKARCRRLRFLLSTFPSQQKCIMCHCSPFTNIYLNNSSSRSHGRRHGWRLSFALNTDQVPDNSDQQRLDGEGPGTGQTRLSRIVIAAGRQLLRKLNSARKNFPMKIFLLLLGFYTANALATILGQTGDWDVLVAGVVVAAIEGIGMLMYKMPSSLPSQRLQSLVVMINYWKAGVCLGLFVDAFKLGS
ncbi:hypothetical protein Droror1_Dr00025152 [Drosera rotundifolia]